LVKYKHKDNSKFIRTNRRQNQGNRDRKRVKERLRWEDLSSTSSEKEEAYVPAELSVSAL